ncbi:DUF748 domain-containing protein [Chryseolinea lacunae]|uniref:DUF748 domain-containing protein n=1 Tax=Chryseolinea lacunae TaxID=2801331 RepID=A0ABS1L074_9BACT|nr:DUF748 domain-containing protein [Chryseolinea lacunae]MBL0745106.1 DUF748 domain-containing protein [Chryseolinea lacunae]
MKHTSSTRILRRVGIALVIVFALALVGGFVLSLVLKQKVTTALARVNGTIDDLDVNLFTQSITATGLRLTYPRADSADVPHHVSLKSVHVGGISLYQWLAHKKISIATLEFRDGDVRYNTTLKQRKSSGDSPLKGIAINAIVFDNVRTNVQLDSVQSLSGVLNLRVSSLQLDSLSKGNNLSALYLATLQGDVTAVTHVSKFYTTRVGTVHVHSGDENIRLDSISVTPNYSRFAFAHRVGKQTDRFTLRVPQVEVKGMKFDQLKDSIVAMAHVNIVSPTLLVFRDKRVPFRNYKKVQLPMAMIRAFPFLLVVDSLKLRDARIVYEEFPEQGFHTGQVEFSHLNAALGNLRNRGGDKNGHATLIASAQLMGQGRIDANFTLPYDNAQPYKAEGHIRKLALPRLNPALENMAFVSIESGRLNDLYFNFYYTDDGSKGSVVINYEDLKINGLTKEKDSHTSGLKSWIINLFLKKDKDRTVSEAKRLGVIQFERDKRKAIFNLWWKSILSGLKSSVLDGPAKKEEKKKG